MAPWAVSGLVVVAATGALLLARRMLLVVRVDGASMEPTFRAGQAVLAVRPAPWRPPRRQDIVVCRLPDRVPGPPGLLIKRVTGIAGDVVATGVVPPGQVSLRGDAVVSYDSRQFGPIPVRSVVGYVVARLAVSGPGRSARRSEQAEDVVQPGHDQPEERPGDPGDQRGAEVD